MLPEKLRLEPELFAAEPSYPMVLEEGIPFQEAYRRVRERYRR